MTSRFSQRAKQDMRYALDHIDVGFPYVTGYPWEDRMNGARESAWGHSQLAANPSQRIGLER
jgi:hypothetical protein